MSEQLKQFLEATQYRITGGSEFQWSCYGSNAQYVDTSICESFYASAIIDRETQRVYEVHISDDEDNHLPFRWIDPEFLEAHKKEAKLRNIDHKRFVDDKTWADTDTFEDIIEKVRAIYAGEEYDARVVMQIDMPDDLFSLCAKAAHERDITFNQFIAKALEAAIEEAKRLEQDVDSKD
jgi:hypothetical protein